MEIFLAILLTIICIICICKITIKTIKDNKELEARIVQLNYEIDLLKFNKVKEEIETIDLKPIFIDKEEENGK